ncbi:MAG: hypothetical protein HQL70_10105 [Magnetococcales bacterium]|nr:hypothetical protein [Magnetococcales bacterium]
MSNYFAAENLILNKLDNLNSDFKLITSARNLQELQNHPGPSPALYLIYDGQEPFMGAGSAQIIDQSWLTVIVVRSARDTVTGAFERLEAGPLIIKLCEALLGWQPDSQYGALTIKTAPGPIYNNGLGYYPVRFSTRLTLRGQ